MVVDDVLVGAHRHDCGLDLDLVQDFLFGDFHDADCPAFIGQLSVEGLVDGAHGAFAELLGEAVELVWVVGQEGDSLDLLVELRISQEGIIGDLLLLLQARHDLDHDLRVVLDDFFADVVLIE